MNRTGRSLAAAVCLSAALGVGAGAQDQQIQRPAVLNAGMIEELRADGPVRSLAGAARAPFAEPITAAKIRRAIDDAVQYIRGRQRPDGSIGYEANGGSTALGALAVLAAGGDPASDAALRRALDWLAARETDNTYVRGIRANVWEYALRKVPQDEGIRMALKKDSDWLLQARGTNSVWRYTLRSAPDWDNSCSQYGVLGIWAAARAGLAPGDAFWQDMSRHFLGCQNADGGWGYQKSASTANMATAGLASMFLVFDMFHGKSCYSADNPRAFSTGEAADCLRSIRRGMDWLEQTGLSSSDAYFLYGIERVGVASGRKYIGNRDWFREGALAVLRAQQADGSISLGSWGDVVVRTAFCALFLVYGGAPVAFDKLEYGADQDWNLNPRDLANLTREMWSAYEQPLNWHSVGIGAPAEEFEAPILFVSGSRAYRFSDEEVAKLRDYILRGGTIFAEPTDRIPAFRKSVEDLAKRMFPQAEYPSFALAPLPVTHGVYTVLKQSWKKQPALSGASDGSRTFLFLSDDYLSADWQMNRADSDAFRRGMNLLFYATDLAPLEGRFASILPETVPLPAKKRIAVVSRIRYTGSAGAPMDWAAGAGAWKAFAPYVRHVTGRGLEEEPPVDLAAGVPAGVDLLHLTGRRAVTLSAAEREALRKYVDGGGTVLADAYAGSAEFAASARREVEAVFGPLCALDPAALLATGRFEGGADLARGLRLTLPARREPGRNGGAASGVPGLEAVMRQGRPAVIFSRFDLTAALAGVRNYQSKGYKPESARRIACNILALATAE